MFGSTLTNVINGICANGLLLVAMTGLASAQDSGARSSGAQAKAVLELYTSQGCNSCPPADALLGIYAKRDDLVALTLPVDYWDYLGWKDTFASPKFTARQRAYAKERGDGRIYTPQIVVNGMAHVLGRSAADIDRAIAQTSARFTASRVPITTRIEGARIVIEAGDAALASGTTEATIWLAVLQKEAEVPVRSGENRGKSLKYYNVVRELTTVGMWKGKAERFELARDAVKLPDTQSGAVLIQSGTAGPIIGASMLPTL